MRQAITDRPTLSLLQVMKLVAFCAAALGSLAPMLNLWRAGVVQGGTLQGLISVALFEAAVIPMTWAGLCFVLVHRGPRRDRLISGLLLWTVAVAFGFACWVFAAYTIPAFGNPSDPPESRIGVRFAALHALAILALAAAALFLSSRLWSGVKPGPAA